MIEVSLADQTYVVNRPKLRQWLDAERFRGNAIDGADKGDAAGFVSGITSFLSVLLLLPQDEISPCAWYEVLDAYYLVSLENAVRLDLSIIHASKKEHENQLPDVWEYDERLWYSWVHLLAKSYGWNIEYISELDVDDAFALLQEISLNEQFDKEWQYGLSENAYEYDKASKKSKLRPLPRPSWMTTATEKVKNDILERVTKKVRRTPQPLVPAGIIFVDGKDNTNTLKSDGDTTAISNPE